MCPELKVPSAARGLVYNDPLTGIFDKGIEGKDYGAYYRGLTPMLKNSVKGKFAPAFEMNYRLSSLLENKADFSVRLKKAYDNNDTAALSALALECDTVIEKLKALKDAHMEAWMEYNKPFGWEVFDIRYGGLTERFVTAKKRLMKYLSGEIEHIEELEAERLPVASGDSMRYRYNYTDCATVNIL